MLAIIPARAGSKGLPGKNIHDLAGHPLIAWTIDVAHRSNLFDKIVVSTDDEKIGRISQQYGATFVRRPDELASDTATPKDAVIHAYRLLEGDGYRSEHIVLLQPTSPLRTVSDILNCVSLVTKSEFDSAATFTLADPHPLRAFFVNEDGSADPVHSDSDVWLPRQARIPQFHLNGAVYIVQTDALLANTGRQFLLPKIGACVMSPERSIDIDTLADLEIAQVLMDGRNPPKLRKELQVKTATSELKPYG